MDIEHGDFIRALGGPSFVAELTHVTRCTPVKWSHRGIPACHWLVLARAATDAGLDVTAEDLERCSPRAINGRVMGRMRAA